MSHLEAAVVFCRCGYVGNRPVVDKNVQQWTEEPHEELSCPECGDHTSPWVTIRRDARLPVGQCTTTHVHMALHIDVMDERDRYRVALQQVHAALLHEKPMVGEIDGPIEEAWAIAANALNPPVSSLCEGGASQDG